MLTDGGDSVRALVGELSPGAEHHLDWFHIAMRLTGLEPVRQGPGAPQSRRSRWRCSTGWSGSSGGSGMATPTRP